MGQFWGLEKGVEPFDRGGLGAREGVSVYGR